MSVLYPQPIVSASLGAGGGGDGRLANHFTRAYHDLAPAKLEANQFVMYRHEPSNDLPISQIQSLHRPLQHLINIHMQHRTAYRQHKGLHTGITCLH